MPALRLALLALLSFAGSPLASQAPAAGTPYAWYRDEGLHAIGDRVTTWRAAAGGEARNLTQVVGKPQLVLTATPTGHRPILRLRNGAALWQTAKSWGTLSGERTVVLYAKLSPASDGCLFDGSTRVGSTPLRRAGGDWQGTAAATGDARAEAWQTLAFAFDARTTPLGGFILGADVAAKNGLSCDVAEVLLYQHTLGGDELAKLDAELRAKWGSPQDLPSEAQPKALQEPTDSRIVRRMLRSNGEQGVHTYRIPGLATTKAGTLIAVFDIRHRGSGDLPADIDVGMMRSTDDGATWSPMQKIVDFDADEPGSHGNGVGDPAVLVDQVTGTLFVAALWSHGPRAWNGSGPGLTPAETGQLVLVHSNDDGVTWSAPRNLTAEVKDPAWRLCFNGPGNGIQLRDGSLVFPAQFKDAANVPHSCFLASSDHGATWRISPPAIPAAPPTSESAIVELDDGSLLLSMRNEARAGKRAWSLWQRKGSVHEGNWSESWLAATDPTCMASLLRHPRGDLLLSNPDDVSRRIALTVRSSADGGATWSKGRVLDAGGAMYSCMTVLRDGSIGMLYESVDADGLVFAKFPLEWVREGAERSDVPAGRTETVGKFAWWPARHQELRQRSRAGGVDVVFLGDSITQGWEGAGKDAWARHFAPLAAANHGFGGDSTQHVLWRITNGELDGLSPKAVVLLVGTNNVRHGDFTPEEIVAGIRAVLAALAEKCPDATILLHTLLPRGTTPEDPYRRKCEAINALLPALADGRRVRLVDFYSQLLAADGEMRAELSPDRLHLNAAGYELWAQRLLPEVRAVLAGK